jgi:hypothetical protein
MTASLSAQASPSHRTRAPEPRGRPRTASPSVRLVAQVVSRSPVETAEEGRPTDLCVMTVQARRVRSTMPRPARPIASSVNDAGSGTVNRGARDGRTTCRLAPRLSNGDANRRAVGSAEAGASAPMAISTCCSWRVSGVAAKPARSAQGINLCPCLPAPPSEEGPPPRVSRPAAAKGGSKVTTSACSDGGSQAYPSPGGRSRKKASAETGLAQGASRNDPGGSWPDADAEQKSGEGRKFSGWGPSLGNGDQGVGRWHCWLAQTAHQLASSRRSTLAHRARRRLAATRCLNSPRRQLCRHLAERQAASPQITDDRF